MLTVSGLTYTTESVAFYYALVAFTFAGADDIDKVVVAEELDGECVTEFVLSFKSLELGQVALAGYTGFFEVSELGLCQVLFFLLLELSLIHI